MPASTASSAPLPPARRESCWESWRLSQRAALPPLAPRRRAPSENTQHPHLSVMLGARPAVRLQPAAAVPHPPTPTQPRRHQPPTPIHSPGATKPPPPHAPAGLTPVLRARARGTTCGAAPPSLRSWAPSSALAATCTPAAAAPPRPPSSWAAPQPRAQAWPPRLALPLLRRRRSSPRPLTWPRCGAPPRWASWHPVGPPHPVVPVPLLLLPAAHDHACLCWRAPASALRHNRVPLQGDRNDPFGSYLAGLRLGTGF